MIKYPILMKWIGTTTKEGILVFRFTDIDEATIYMATGDYVKEWRENPRGDAIENPVIATDVEYWEVYEDLTIQYEPTDEWGCFMEGYNKCSQVKD